MAWKNRTAILIFLAASVCLATAGSVATAGEVPKDAPVLLAQRAEPAGGKSGEDKLAGDKAAAGGAADPARLTPQDESLEAKMARRFPQKARVGDLIGLPVLDDDDVTLGHVQQVVRSPEGKIKLIVSYSRWFGWFGRPVAVPIEAVAILAKQIASLEMQPDEYAKAATWTAGADRPLADSDIIRIALTRR
jgi:PRC-barrel domain